MGGRSSEPWKLERIDRSADMPDRRRNQETVDIPQSPEGGRAPYRGMGGVVAVKHTLGPTGGSRGERDRFDAGRIDPRRLDQVAALGDQLFEWIDRRVRADTEH